MTEVKGPLESVVRSRRQGSGTHSEAAHTWEHETTQRTSKAKVQEGVGSRDRAVDVRAAEPNPQVRALGRVRSWVAVPVIDVALMLAPLAWKPQEAYPILAMTVLATVMLAEGGRYTAPLHVSVLDRLPFITSRLFTAVAAVSMGMLVMQQTVTTFLNTALQSVALVVIGRFMTARLITLGREKGLTAARLTVAIGGGAVACEIARTLSEHPEYGMRLVGYVDEGARAGNPLGPQSPQLGRLEDLSRILTETGADSVLLADGQFQDRAAVDALRANAIRLRNIFVVPRFHEFQAITGVVDQIGSIPITRIRNSTLHAPTRVIKRLFDIVVSFTALVVLLPALVLVGLAVRLEGGPGVIFRQVRVGRHGRCFELFKFRTMRPANELEAQTQWSVATDSRVSRLGRFLRRTSIDELPQLWNVLRGDMTMVGPRPERPHFVELFSRDVERYADRHRVQVGLTGLAQVSGLRGNTSIADRARFDNYYIENWSLWLDVKIILRTFVEVFFYRER